MRYFFHVREADQVIRDQEGSELADLAAARHEAWLSACDLALEDIRHGGPVRIREIQIADDKGNVIAVVPVLDILN